MSEKEIAKARAQLGAYCIARDLDTGLKEVIVVLVVDKKGMRP